MRYVVILFTGRDCPGFEGMNTCPMSAHPFGTHEQAEAFAKAQPEWTRPHTLTLIEADR